MLLFITIISLLASSSSFHSGRSLQRKQLPLCMSTPQPSVVARTAVLSLSLIFQFTNLSPLDVAIADTIPAGSDIVGEQIRKAAAILPGLGKPDIYYPSQYQGQWEMEQTITGIVSSSPPTTPVPSLIQGYESVLANPGDKTARYTRVYSSYDGKTILDRGVTTANLLSALNPTEKSLVTFNPANPNLVNIMTSSGKKIELRVTKRSVEDMGSVVNGRGTQDASETAAGISYSEFARAIEQDGPDGVPRQWGLRLLARYKEGADPGSLVGLERLYVYRDDGVDLGEQQPLKVIKSKVSMKRLK